MKPYAALAVALCTLLFVVAAAAGTAPNRLDRNLGVVVPAPRIHNLYWDDLWNTRHPTFTRGMINTFTARISASGYANGLAQYGVAPPAFASTHISSALYLPGNTTIIDALRIPQRTLLGRTFGPFTISRTSCADYGAYHAWGVAITATFALAIIPTRCATTVDTGFSALDNITLAASHEIVEAATNPYIALGRIDNSIPIGAPGFRRLSEGEASDICDFLPTPATPVRRLGSLFSPYWSNSAGACVTN